MVIARADIFRLWLSPDGAFTDDPAGSALAPTTDFGSVDASFTDAGPYYRITTGALNIRVNKAPLRFSVYRADNTTPVWRESRPTSWTGTRTTQYLARGADEQFYGTGLRLGEWALRDKTVPVAVDNKWRENDNASPAPFYMSTNGYGVMRNTWAPGSYGFNAPTTLTHDETRFDGWYFTGDSLKSVLDAYTDVSGKPFMAPPSGASNSATRTVSTPPTPSTRATTAARATRPPPTWPATPPTPAPPTCPRAGSSPTTATAAATPRR
ncbi:hypothetical protein GCM10020254_12160 [Streptomyces goshikiensis]